MGVISLQTAVLCTNCEAISDNSQQCELCGSRAVLSLARALGKSSVTSSMVGKDSRPEPSVSAPKQPHADSRRFPRYMADFPVVALVMGAEFIEKLSGRGEVISQNGMAAQMNRPIMVGDVVSLELHFPKLPEIRIRAIVRNNRATKCGFEFLALADAERELIARYCRLRPEPLAYSVSKPQ